MRMALWVILLGAALEAQVLVESAAATGAVASGIVAGKTIGEGAAGIFKKIDKATAEAAGENSPGLSHKGTAESAAPVASGRAKAASTPPPNVRTEARSLASPNAAPPPSPPPVVTVADLKTIAIGTNREDVLKLGVPATRIMMYDDGHMVEIFRYMSGDTSIGVVRLTDGIVSSVKVE